MPTPARILARWTLASFLITFVVARVCVLLIMTRRMPDLYFWAGGTHVHHLNYGIFLLVFVAGWSIFAPPRDRGRKVLALLYGVALGLTFDEFGMWLHLDDVYWQRASYDGVLVIGSLLALIAVAPSVRHFKRIHWVITGVLLLLGAITGWLIVDHAQHWNAELQEIERTGPAGS